MTGLKQMTQTEYDKIMAEELYDVNDRQLVEQREHARDLYETLNQTSFHDKEKLQQLINQLFGTVGIGSEVRPRFVCDYGYNIHVGNNFFANFDCILLDTCPITIGDNALLAPRVQIYTAAHPLDVKTRTSWLGCGKAVSIGNNCWLGGNAVILPGVHLGNNVIVGGGAVVTKSFGDNVVIAGNPAQVIKHLQEGEATQYRQKMGH